MNFDEVDKAIRAARVETFHSPATRLEADHAHLKAWNEELVVLLKTIGLDVAWAQKDELRERITRWVADRAKPDALDAAFDTYDARKAIPRCLAALEEKIGALEREAKLLKCANEVLKERIADCDRRHYS